jgi:hypothetical protein
MAYKIQTQPPEKVSHLGAKTIFLNQGNARLFLATGFEFVYAVTALYFRNLINEPKM